MPSTSEEPSTRENERTRARASSREVPRARQRVEAGRRARHRRITTSCSTRSRRRRRRSGSLFQARTGASAERGGLRRALNERPSRRGRRSRDGEPSSCRVALRRLASAAGLHDVATLSPAQILAQLEKSRDARAAAEAQIVEAQGRERAAWATLLAKTEELRAARLGIDDDGKDDDGKATTTTMQRASDVPAECPARPDYAVKRRPSVRAENVRRRRRRRRRRRPDEAVEHEAAGAEDVADAGGFNLRGSRVFAVSPRLPNLATRTSDRKQPPLRPRLGGVRGIEEGRATGALDRFAEEGTEREDSRF